MAIRNFLEKSPLVPMIFCGRYFQGLLDKSFRGLGITLIDALVLAALFYEGRFCRPSEIAANLELSRSQVSQSLKRLEAKAYIERSLDKGDARSLNLRLTASGTRQTQKVIKVLDELTWKIEKSIGLRKSEGLGSDLRRLTKKFSTEKPMKEKA